MSIFRAACGWVADWKGARAAGDDVAAFQAASLMMAADVWPVLDLLEGNNSERGILAMVGRQLDKGTDPVAGMKELGCA